MPTTGEIRQIVGLLEGEGSFSYKDGLRINLAMTDADVVHTAKRIMGSDKRVYVEPKGRFRTQYRLVVSSTLAASWMMTIYPFMGVRRRGQIAAALAKWRVARGASQDRRTCPQGHPYDRQRISKLGTTHRQCSLCLKRHNHSPYMKRRHLKGLRRPKYINVA